ncbi:MAG: adenylate/guanylate cyclase domain-containing protein, partial [Pseudomonadota bacterium]
ADTFATPLTWRTGTVMSGIEIHATAIENAIRAQAVDPVHPVTRWLLISLMVFGSVFSLEKAQVRAGIVIAAGWLALVCAAVFGLWHLQRLFLPPLALMAIPVGALARRVAIVARQERQNRLELKRTFSLYLSASVVDEIAAHPEKVEMGGEQRDITVLFTDLEGFTSLSERLPPRMIANLLNEYFELMTQAVFRYQGTLDKFIGDAVMAFWGAPIPQEDHPRRAVACAMDMLAALESFNQSLREKGQSPLKMRIGIHTGVAVVGNLGCPSRFSFTALGDTVNLASRLESANKNHGTNILMSEATVKGLPPEISTRFVARIQVKGREEPVAVYTCP